ncbi:class F sortase [Nocardioides oleivorans]|uniref:Class F sortase n=1 Tax=Nocardioides oleivorans TaxID=273676 RepID=A0A4Q2S1E2_9ACTN|nr:class F sortase [Nocardioides oleivorans]RYB93843.1 class F sortase [Nocardioides oleivorans]
MSTHVPRHASDRPHRPRGRRAAIGLLVVAVLVLVGAIAVRLTSTDDRADASVVDPASTPRATTSAAASSAASSAAPAAIGRRTGAATPEPPTRAVLPSGVDVPIVPVSTTDDGTLDVPGDITTAGWWRGGSRLGDPFGSTLVSAHVDSTTQGLGPYAELLTVRAGQRIELQSKHLRQSYVVSSLRLLDKGPLSDHPWVYSATGAHRLVMVTCAGPFVPAKGGYQRLAVVTATAVGRPTQKEA